MNEEDIPAPTEDYLKPGVKFGPFPFEGEEYLQHSSLVMEADHYRHIKGRLMTWLRYEDDVALTLLGRMDLTNILRRLNEVHPKINSQWRRRSNSNFHSGTPSS